MVSLSNLTANQIKKGSLKKELPELYDLQGLYEENAWHNHDEVFTHVLKVFENSQNLLKKDYPSKKNLDPEVLLWSALLHDIAKPETFTQNPDGSTICRDHEAKGSQKTKKILSRFDLSLNHKNKIISLVKHHGETHEILNPQKNPAQLDKEFKKLKKLYPRIYFELIYLSLADTQSAQLKQNKPKEYQFRINFYLNLIT